MASQPERIMAMFRERKPTCVCNRCEASGNGATCTFRGWTVPCGECDALVDDRCSYISLPAWKEFCSVEDAKPENKDATRAYSDLYHDAESYFLSPRSLHLAATTEAYRNVLGRIHDPLILEMISVVIKTYNTSSILQKLVQERWLELQ
ncbi:hypothetical protein B0H14DRAFT_3133296 [Mycena olivaceomarginata]|nr:hypothetical protein B0H14DRAFT_3133296 [Mycena olivaceomarginata]